MTKDTNSDLEKALARRYQDAPSCDNEALSDGLLLGMAGRGSCRNFLTTPVPDDLLAVLCAVAFASPTKSDLQQRDAVILRDAEQRARLAALVPGQNWVQTAPLIVVFCGNNRRQRLLHEWRNVPFANDHLDAFFNATADAAIALGAFVTAAEALGLGCCPISAVRNEAAAVSELLVLPDYVFPVAGLAVGYPASKPTISPRLPLQVTCHENIFAECNLSEAVELYDRDRARVQPYANQRFEEEFGTHPSYCWSEDKVRQYSKPERETFGAFVRSKGFSLE